MTRGSATRVWGPVGLLIGASLAGGAAYVCALLIAGIGWWDRPLLWWAAAPLWTIIIAVVTARRGVATLSVALTSGTAAFAGGVVGYVVYLWLYGTGS